MACAGKAKKRKPPRGYDPTRRVTLISGKFDGLCLLSGSTCWCLDGRLRFSSRSLVQARAAFTGSVGAGQMNLLQGFLLVRRKNREDLGMRCLVQFALLCAESLRLLTLFLAKLGDLGSLLVREVQCLGDLKCLL